MSIRQSEYARYRRDLIVADKEFTHTTLLDFDFATEIVNNDGEGTDTPWMDIHEIPKDLIDWDGVWNFHVQLIASKFMQDSVRISRLHQWLGIEDPEAKRLPDGPGSVSVTGAMPAVNDTIYTFLEPSNLGKVDDIIDSTSAVVSIAQLQSIVGTRNYTGVISDGFDWRSHDDRDGNWVSYSTTITHNIDQLDQTLGPLIAHTGYTNKSATGFWNAIDVKSPFGNRDVPSQWSLTENIELLNRSIGSREVPNPTWNVARSTILTSNVNANYPDAQQTVTDFVIDFNNILGNRRIQASPANVYSLPTVYPIQNAGLDTDNTTYTAMLSSVNEAIGHRVIEDRGNYFAMRSSTGNTVTAWINTINKEIGNRVIANQTEEYVLKSSDNHTVTQIANTINVALGDRRIINSAASFCLQGLLGTSDGLTFTSYINTLNTEIGDRAYTQPHLTASETISGSIKSIAYHLGSLLINNDTGNHVLKGMSNTTTALSGSTASHMLDALNTAIGDRDGSNRYTTNGTTLTARSIDIETALNYTDLWLGKSTGVNKPGDDITTTKFIRPLSGLSVLLDILGSKLELTSITSLVDADNTVPIYNTNGWFSNLDADTNNLGSIIQQLIDRIDSITGWDT